MQDVLMCNALYHLRGEGNQIQTTKLIEDIRNALTLMRSSNH